MNPLSLNNIEVQVWNIENLRCRVRERFIMKNKLITWKSDSGFQDYKGLFFEIWHPI